MDKYFSISTPDLKETDWIYKLWNEFTKNDLQIKNSDIKRDCFYMNELYNEWKNK